jgi:hypothetical protein
MLPLSRPPLSPTLAIHRAPASQPTYFPAHTGLSAQTYTSSSYSPAGTPLDEQPHIHLSAPPSEMPEPTQVRQTDALRSIDDETEEEESMSGDQFRDMHLTVDDHAGDPATRYEMMELLGTGNFGKVYKA